MDFLIRERKYAVLPVLGMLLIVFLLGAFNEGTPSVHEKIRLQKDTELSTVVLNNETELLPLVSLKGRKIVSVNTGSVSGFVFDSLSRNYTDVKSLMFRNGDRILTQENLKSFNTVLIQVTPESLEDPQVVSFIYQTKANKEVIIAGFGNTGYLKKLNDITSPLIWSTVQNASSANYAAQVLFGGIASTTRLTDSISPRYNAGSGYSTKKIRLKYSIPEEEGVNSHRLSKIDKIMDEAIAEHATPGGVVMVVKSGTVIFEKAYGKHIYDKGDSTRVNDIYDLASVTKVAATTIAAMSLYEQKKLDLYAPLSDYLPETKGTNKARIAVREAMLHQAGFPNLDFMSYVKPYDHSLDSSSSYPVKVADNYFLRRDFYKEVMWPKMIATPISTRGKYVYSDISMYVMKEIIERQTSTSLDKYVMDEFYKPLGMRKAAFNPLKYFNRNEIVPTEDDHYFRRELLQGYVHDQGAALVNGVSGHAGLFSSANDLAILTQMLLNKGNYGGIQYFKPETVDLFTSRQSNVSRRGLGFDRASSNYPSRLASEDTYGHTGFTGTCVWVDPKYDLIYIFLSNRIYPSAASSRLNSMRIRPRIQDVIYEAIEKGV